ncbi:hypothetical protein TorRG33x02_328320 [Trema orientale]|uniref:Uncharacterized protein n=1 Tax=Trema orientale TaxID=63057 RepID=A0A2P5B9Y2_TREOI|nr:hypothetical protein TorRG33x02_328320 [Trema orientale]
MIFPGILGNQTPNLKRRRRNLPVEVAEGKARKECVLGSLFWCLSSIERVASPLISVVCCYGTPS